MGITENSARAHEAPLPYAPSPPTVPGTSPPGRETAQDMIAHVIRSGAASGADALRELRAAFPDSPLSTRVAALRLLGSRDEGAPYIPR